METKFNIKAGTYWLGDPCYVYPEKEWDKFCAKCYVENSCILPDEFEPNFVVLNTAYGDGRYPVRRNNRLVGNCCVDSGTLAVINTEIAEKWPDYFGNKHLGVVVTIKKDTELEIFGHNNGNFRFADIEVWTEDEDFD